MNETQPLYAQVKDHILQNIRSGAWEAGRRVPSENELVESFGISRMTANRALRELSDDRILVRVQGSGTFVAQQKFQSTLVEIRSIAEEVQSRGHLHRSELQCLERVKASGNLAADFDLAVGKALFHSVVVHFENDLPIQVEDRFVNPAVAPDYMQIDFGRTTANEYLMHAAPLSGVRYRIEALMPMPEIATMLHIDAVQPCLVLRRKTLSRGQVASVATLWHPANRYQFTGGF